MPGNMTLSVLREYLHGEVDEKLLHYIAMNAHKVLYISFEQLCERAAISEEQAMEFFRAFNAESFVAFKYILRKCLYYEATDRVIVKRSLSSLLDESIRFELHNLTSFCSGLDHDKVEQLAKDIWAAPEVSLLCAGPTLALGQALTSNFAMLKIRSHLYRAGDDTAALETLSPSNLLIVFGFARYNARQIAQVKLLHQRGFRIVCITDSPDSPFIPLTDYHFLLPVDSFDFNTSLISGMAFIEALALALGMQREKFLFSRMHDWDVATQEANMFW